MRIGKARLAARRHNTGFTYLAVLLAVALTGAALAGLGQVWAAKARHDQLVEVHWIGEQYRQAIGRYYESSPGSTKVFPATLDDLLEDKRTVTYKRHLRRSYVSPRTENLEWELIAAPKGGICGIAVTLSELHKREEFVYLPGNGPNQQQKCENSRGF